MHVKTLFTQAIEAVGLKIPDESLIMLIEHYALVEKWNATFNLTSLTRPEDIIDRLYIDSLLFHKNLPPDAPEIHDIGSGPGFPGIPLLIIRPQTRLITVEPKQKMAAFLTEVRHNFRDRLDFEVINTPCDAPGFIDSHRNRLQTVVSKAFAPPGKALMLLSPLLHPDGIYATCVNPGTRIEISPDCPFALYSEHIHSLPLTGKPTRHLIFRHK